MAAIDMQLIARAEWAYLATLLFEAMCKRSAIGGFGRRGRYVAIGKVTLDCQWIALFWIAISTGARRPQTDDVAVAQGHDFFRTVAPGLAIRDHQGLADRTGTAAENSVRCDGMTVAQKRQHGAIGHDADVLANAATSAELPDATRIRDQLEALDAYGIVVLDHFDRDVRAIHDGRHGFDPVFHRAAPIPSKKHVIHDERSARARVGATDVGVGPM